MITMRLPGRHATLARRAFPVLAAVLALCCSLAPAASPAAIASRQAAAPPIDAAPQDAPWGTLSEPPSLVADPPKDPSADWRVAAVADADQVHGHAAAVQRAKGLALDVEEGRIRLILEASDVTAARRGAVAVGADVEASAGDFVQVLAAPGQIRRLARAAGVRFVRPPRPHRETAVAGQGVGAAGASAWHAAGLTGAGVKVAIIDAGFTGYAAAQASGDLPASLTTADYCSGGLATASEHGTAVAEIVHEMAPAGQLYLICIETEVQLAQAEAYAEANGIQVINHSMSWVNSSRGDGTGSAGSPDWTAARAREAGILWVNAAGNEAETHWSGSFVDDGTGWNLFAPGNIGNGFYLDTGGTVCAFLKWDNWPGSAQDYDLYLVDQASTIVGASLNDQTGIQPPTEDACYTNPGAAAVYYVAINKSSATLAPRFDLFMSGVAALAGADIQYPVAAGSVTEPASSPAAMAVGAVCWGASTIESFSSQGPTIDGRTKPDISGPDQVSSATYGSTPTCDEGHGFWGTSASAPHVAGAAALAKGRSPSLTVGSLQAYLETNALDLGVPGDDPIYGSGMLHLPALVAPTPVPTPTPTPTPTPVPTPTPRPTTTVSLAANPPAAVAGETLVTLTATLSAATATGAVTFRDVTSPTPQTLGTVAVADSGAAVQVRLAGAGTHVVDAVYGGDAVYAPATSNVVTIAVSPDVVVSASGVGVSAATFYPYRDGYRDTVMLRGTLLEPAAVAMKIYSPTGRLVRSLSVPLKTGAYSVAWNGRTSSGTLVAAGRYKVVQTITDVPRHRKAVTSYTTISSKRLYWSSHTITLYGAQYTMYGDPGSGSVSRSGSAYEKGVRLTSGDSWAGVRYTFALRSAVVYKPLAFKVLGRSPNGQKAYEGLWNRTLGSAAYTSSYDRREIGPRYTWYSLAGDPTTHRSGRTTYGAVYVESAGVSRIFDIAKVQLTYRYAVLR